MAKFQNAEDTYSSINKIEDRILEKLFILSNKQTPLTNDNELRKIFTDNMGSSNFDIALQNLIVGGFVSRIGDNEYQITMNGIDEHSRRTNADVLF
ncbi:hypothetical protein [Candidatus Nitrosocosmicus sp. R]